MLGNLQKLLDKNLITVAARQFEFSRYIDKHDWNLDSIEGILYFTNRSAFEAQIIGSESFEDNTWRWAWADPQYKESPMVKSAHKLRKLGIKQELTLLTRKSCSIDTSVNGFTLASIALDIAKADCFYSYSCDNDSRLYMLLKRIGKDEFESTLPEQDILYAFEQLMPDISFDHYTSLKNACIAAGLQDAVSEQKISLGGVDVIFDAVGNCLDMKKPTEVVIKDNEKQMDEKTTRKRRRSRSTKSRSRR